MGFNLRQKLEETFADINPFDNGATAQTVRANRAKAQPAQTVKTQTQNRPMFQQNNQPAFTQQKQFKVQTQSPSLNFNNSVPKVQAFGQSSDPLKVGQVKTPQIQTPQPAPVQQVAKQIQQPTAQQAPMMLTPQARQDYARKQQMQTQRPQPQKPAFNMTPVANAQSTPTKSTTSQVSGISNETWSKMTPQAQTNLRVQEHNAKRAKNNVFNPLTMAGDVVKASLGVVPAAAKMGTDMIVDLGNRTADFGEAGATVIGELNGANKRNEAILQKNIADQERMTDSFVQRARNARTQEEFDKYLNMARRTNSGASDITDTLNRMRGEGMQRTDPMKTISNAGMTALDLATLGKGKMILEGAKLGTKVTAPVLSQLAKNTAITGLQGSGIGGAYGGLSTMKDPNATAEDYAKNIGMGALVGGGLGIGAQVALPVAGIAAKQAVKGTESAIVRSANYGLKPPTNLSKDELYIASKVRQAREGYISPQDLTTQEVLTYQNIQRKLGAQPGTPDGDMAVVNALGAHRDFETKRGVRKGKTLDGLEKSSKFAQEHLIPAGSLRGVGDDGLPLARRASQFEQDLQAAGVKPTVKPDTYVAQPKDIKKAIDAQIAKERADLAYSLNENPQFPDGIPKVRPEDVMRISGLSPKELGIPPRYISKSAAPIDEQALGHVRDKGIEGVADMSDDDYLDLFMDAINANRDKAQISKNIRELRNDPKIIERARQALEQEKAQYGAPEVFEPSKSDLREYANMATPGTASTARQSARSRQQKPGLSTNPQPDLPQSKQLSSLQQKLGSAEPTPDSPVNESITSLDSTTKPQVNQVKVKQAGREKNVPVMKQTRDGDVITATNVNDKIKVGEKRYSVDEYGKLIEDKKGATSLFTDEEGRVTGFRVGKEYFDVKDLGDLTSVNGYGSTLATMRRNVERAFDKKTGDKVSAFLVDHQQGQATKLIQRQVEMKQGMQSLADDLGINFASGTKRAKKVSAAIQDFGEGKRNRASLVAEYGNQTADKIIAADKWFRKNYDALLDEMNSTLKQFGYDPVPKRANYYTHFQDEGLWQKFGLKMQEIRDLSSPTMQDANPTGGRGSISNKLAGMSENTSPNKAFNKFALQRKGNKHTSDAFKAFELYLNPTLNNIYMTPSISRARVLSRAIAQDADIVGKDANKTIVQIREWANSLAGKSSRIGDRQLADTMAGPHILKALGWAQKKTGQNTIVGNLSTAVMQPIVLAQTAGKFGYKNTLAGLYQQASGALKSAQAQSGFLARRYTKVTPVTAGKLDRGADIANKPLEIVEENAVRSTWNAAHNDAVSRGITGKNAIRYADIETEKTVAGRSIGERPEAFRSKSAGLATMFQLEVNNFWQQTSKEMSKGQAAKMLVAMYGLNLGLEALTGRQVGFNPIDAAIDSYDEATKERPGEENSALERGKRIGQRWTGEFVDNAPFIGMAANTAFGEEKVKEWTGDNSNTGRFGASSPIRTLLDNPWMAVSPMAGGQIKKTTEAIPVLVEGKLKDKDGNTLVNVPQTPENIAKGLAFGKGSIPEVNQYYDNLGKSKVDQKLVKNQSVSKAGSMSLDGLTKEQQTMLSTAREDMKPSLIEQYRKDNKAGYTAEKSGTKAPAKKSTAKPLPANMSSTAKSILESYNSMSTEDKKKWDKTTATGTTARSAMNNWLGGKAEVPKISNEIARDWANYEKGIKDGSINVLEKDTKKKEILRKAFNEQLSDVEKTMYKLSKADIQRYAESGDITEANLNKALAVEKQLFNAGLISKETLASKLGVAARGYKGKTGRKSSGKGGRKVAKGKFDYKLNGFGTTNTSNSKQLHDLLKKATMRVSA